MTDPITHLNTALEGRYHIEREIGAGGMATVYLADDLKHERKVALKVLKPELAAVVGAERFLAEIKTTANLQHPHILPLFDSGEADGFLYYVMPYVDGETLRDRLDREKQLPVDEAVRIATEVAEALEHAHAKGVIHRDIKPANILLRDGRVQVADFGIALAVSAAGVARLTETGLSVGTPHYMSPEQASGDRELDGRSDLYSLGCVLYEMLVGEPPHTGPTAQAIFSKILTEEPKPLSQLRRSVPLHLEAAMHTALEKLPADRFSDAGGFNMALGHPSFRGRGQSASRPTPRDRRARLLGPLAAFALVMTLLALWPWVFPGGTEPESVRRLPLAIEDPPRETNNWGPTIAISSDGSKMAYHGPERVWWARSWGQLEAVPLNETRGAQVLSFSPDGRSVVYRKGGWLGQVTAKTLAGDRPDVVLSPGLGQGLAWAKDDWVYFIALDYSLARVPASGGEREILIQADTLLGTTRYSRPEPLPNGKGVLYNFGTRGSEQVETTEIGVLDLQTRSSKTLGLGLRPQYSSSGHLVFVRANGVLMAAPFDQDAMELRGEAVEVEAGISIGGIWAGAEMNLSKSGDLLYVRESGGDVDDVAWVNREGIVEIADSAWGGRLAYPRLSPDGHRLAVTRYQDQGRPNIWVKELPDGALTKLTFGDVLDFRAKWSPDGSRVAFTGPRPPQSFYWDLYSVPSEGGPEAVLLDRVNEVREGFWSPDGEWVVFQEMAPASSDLYALRLDSPDSPIELSADTAFDEGEAELSPDGRWIAYESNRSGRNEVYVRPFPGASEDMRQVSIEGGRVPQWSRDGREVFFVNEAEEMTVARIRGDPVFAVEDRRVLFSVERYRWEVGFDVTLDGRQLILIRRRDEQAPGDVVLVENFAGQLTSRIGGQ